MSELQQLENGMAGTSRGEDSGRRHNLKRALNLEKNKAVVIYWLYGILITAAEIVVAYENVKLGIFLHIVLLGALMAHSAFAFKSGTPWLYLALILAPLTRILSLSMPLGGIPPVFWYVAISAPLFAAAVGVVRVAGFKYSEVGFVRRNLPVQLLIMLVGFPLGFIEYSILRPQPIVAEFTPEQIWLPALVLIICTGLLEEFIFRGIMYRAAIKAAGQRFALFFVSFIFAVLHITHLSFWDVVFVFAVAVLFTKIYDRQQSIVGLTLAHGMTNITLYIICPLVF
jgi:hypothetical protein